MNYSERYTEIQKRIQRACLKAERSPESLTLIAVSKLQSVDKIVAMAKASAQLDFAENYIQEYREKRRSLENASFNWHFIGHLQRNKAKILLEHAPKLLHSLDSVDLALHLNRIFSENKKSLDCLIELRLGEEKSQKTGILLENLPELLEVMRDCPALHWQGLMLLPPYAEDPEASRPYFRQSRELLEALRQDSGLPLPYLSIGMSHDFEIAIEEGSTHLRIGTALFGARLT